MSLYKRVHMHQEEGAREMGKVIVCMLFLQAGLSLFQVSAGDPSMPMYHASAETSDLAGYGMERLSSVLVTGSITCQSFGAGGSKLISPSSVAGAKIAIFCKDAWEQRKFTWISGGTDEYGDFIVDLPSRLHGNPRLEASCVVRILELPKESPCYQKHLKKTTGIKLASVGNSIRVYSTEAIKLKSLIV